MKLPALICCCVVFYASVMSAQNSIAIEKAIEAAKALPDGPQKDAMLNALGVSGDKRSVALKPSFLDRLEVDYNGRWELAELKKIQVAEMVAPETIIKLKDGRTVNLSSVTSLTPNGLRWIGASIEETHWMQLPESLAKAYGFSDVRQNAYEAWKKVATMDSAQRIAQERRALLEKERESTKKAELKEQLLKERVAVSFRVSQALEQGCLCYGARIERNQYWGRWEGLRWVPGLTVASEHDEPIYIVGLPASTVDGDQLAGWLYPCGVYRYTTVSGAAKAVRKYAISLDIAISQLSVAN